eukprot:Nitzschia sp. Nitz4//scaffold14_size191712//47237//48766//NITZ4_001706-RA/size191712-processed-gene-0.303-mRNA-1//-1//CDS//3329536876//6104//frame0
MGGNNSKPVAEPVNSAIPATPVAPEPVPPITTQEEPKAESKCPMHRGDGSYSYDWRRVLEAIGVHGAGGSKPLSKEEAQQLTAPAAVVETPPSSGGCPVKHNNNAPPPEPVGGCPVKHDSKPPANDGCPVQHKAHPEYNVYSQPIDKTNQMPKGVKTQMPTSTQTAEISTDRVKSSIPKGGDTDEGTTWTYPSPQQFYNALARKGKLGDDASEHDMESVVALHNNMNEKTWAQVVEWEKTTYKSDVTPSLLKFQGRPHDLSPKAMLKHYLLGHPLPYDRHDWTVLRDNGTTIRYIIDYYYDETRARESNDSAKPQLHDRQATPSLLIDVRPALDGATQFMARAVTMPYKQINGQTAFQHLPLRPTPEMSHQVKESIEVWDSIQKAHKQQAASGDKDGDDNQDGWAMDITEDQAKKIAKEFALALSKCGEQQAHVSHCTDEQDCAKASMDLTMCVGPTLCAVQHKSLMNTLQGDDEDKIEAALETLTECVFVHNAKHAMAKEQHPAVFQK